MEIPKQQDFHVALSFAGEDREYVSRVASTLTDMGFRVFYDKHEIVTLWGKDLYTYLREIYFERALYTVMFISKHYAAKLWTNHERESSQARAFQERKEYILPARFDDTKVPGLLPTTYYVDLRTMSSQDFAQLIKEKIGPIPRPNFFPGHPDLLFRELEIEDAATQEATLNCAHHAQKSLSLMTPAERKFLSVAALHACPAGLPNNIHFNLEYLSRVSGLTTQEILQMVSRLDCLGIRSRTYEDNDEPLPQGTLISSKEILELEYRVNSVDFFGNGTAVLCAIFQIITDHLCPDCREKALNTLDLSVLGSMTGFTDRE